MTTRSKPHLLLRSPPFRRQSAVPLASMYSTLRRCATVSPDKAVRFSGKTLTLEHFLQRQKVIKLWRECIRTINSKDSRHAYTDVSWTYIRIEIPPSMPTRREMREYARYEFERYRNVDDLVTLPRQAITVS